MTASALAPRRLGRISTWFAPPPAAVNDAYVEAAPRTLVERRLFADIGEFLFTHRLSPTPAHFEIAHAYLTGSTPSVVNEIAAMLAKTGTVDHGRFFALAQPAADVPRVLAELAEDLEARLDECLDAAGRSHTSARDYGEALDRAQGGLVADPAATLAHIAGLTRDVVTTTRLVESELKHTRLQAEQLRSDLDRAREAAERDHLTGLINRRGLERHLAKLSERGAIAAVALCDVDDFKLINDAHGHPAGDRVLRFVAQFLASELGEQVLVARYGGEEFAVVVDGCTPQEAAMMLDAVRERLAVRSLINQESGAAIGRVAFSAGVARLGADGARALSDADVALYQAKRLGKNTVALAADLSEGAPQV